MSGIAFNVDEVFGMAEQIERNGAKFYRKAAEQLPANKDFLLRLAVMEDEHLQTFSDMHAKFAADAAESTVFDPDNQAESYIRAMADTHVFDMTKDPGEALKGDETMADIAKTAIGLEKESIAFYVGLRELVPTALGSEKIDAIIREEWRHVAVLSQELKQAS